MAQPSMLTVHSTNKLFFKVHNAYDLLNPLPVYVNCVKGPLILTPSKHKFPKCQ